MVPAATPGFTCIRYAAAVDGAGNIYLADTDNDTIRRISSAGVVSTYAGSAGNFGYADGAGQLLRAQRYPSGVAVDANSNVYVADTFNSTIRLITTAQVVSTIAGAAGNNGFSNGVGTNAMPCLTIPSGHRSADTNGKPLRGRTTANNNLICEVAFSGEAAFVTVPWPETRRNSNVRRGPSSAGSPQPVSGGVAELNNPSSVAIDASGNLYVADFINCVIRMISPVGSNWGREPPSASAAGTPGQAGGFGSTARFRYPQGIAVDASGNLYVADTGNYTIRKIEPSGTNWVVSTIGGLAGAQPASTDGTGSAARFYNPEGITVGADGSLLMWVTPTTIQCARVSLPSMSRPILLSSLSLP